MQAGLFQGREQIKSDRVVSAKEARELVRKGQAPAGLVVREHLDLSKSPQLIEIPAGLSAPSLDLSNCPSLRVLPAGLRTRRLDLSGCNSLDQLPAGLDCYELEMRSTPVRALPVDLQVDFRLDLSDCSSLVSLPPGLKVGSLILRNCTALQALPEGLDAYFLDISGCTRLTSWPERGFLQFGRLTAVGCTRLTGLPAWLDNLTQLDVRGCASLRELPEGLRVSSWIDLADTEVRALPASMQGVQLRWRGVRIDERVAFHPETITAQEILETRNVELRRVLLERLGYEAFLREAEAEVLDRDYGSGGLQQLLRVDLGSDEPLVVVSVICPSTARQYIIRVSPTVRTCRQALAWIAGFDNPANYRPILET